MFVCTVNNTKKFMSLLLKENTFDKGDSIMNKSSYIKDYLYVINEGNVSLFKNKNVICTYDKYDCINEIQNENEEIVAMSENVILYSIELKYYKDLIQNEQKTMKISFLKTNKGLRVNQNYTPHTSIPISKRDEKTQILYDELKYWGLISQETDIGAEKAIANELM